MPIAPDGQAATIWFVLPVYFDVESFIILRKRLLDETLSVGGGTVDLEAQFVVVDDTAGRDGDTAQLAMHADTRVLVPPYNLGHQRALVFGLRTVAPEMRDDDIVVTLDADGEDRPEDLPSLLEPILRSGDPSSVALARRTQRQESLSFKIWYFFFRLLFRTLTGTSVRTGNYAAYRGQVARYTLRHPSFDLCYSSTFLCLDLERDFVPCPRGSRYAGESKMNAERLAAHGLRMLMPFLDRIATRALAFFVALFAVGLGLTGLILGIRIFTDAAIPGWTTITVISLAIMSLLALGNFVVLFAVFSQSRGITVVSGENDR